MENAKSLTKSYNSSSYPKTDKEWKLSSSLYDGIEDKDIRLIETLLSSGGANPNILLAEYGIAPFHLAVVDENLDFSLQATNLCLQHGADPNLRSEDGLTPVHLASMWGCSEVLQVLLTSGGDPWMVDSLGMNAFNYALRYKQPECYQVLQHSVAFTPNVPPVLLPPYQLNLKQVEFSNNDLKIVYEASPSKNRASPSTNRKATGTQTTNDGCHLVSDQAMNNTNNYTTKTNSKNCNGSLLHPDVDKFKSKRTHNKLTCHGLREIIHNHRRNSFIYEYDPRENEERGQGFTSENKVPKMSKNRVSRIVEKLNQSFNSKPSVEISKNCDFKLVENVTRRKKQMPINLSSNPEEFIIVNGSDRKSLNSYPESSKNILEPISTSNSGSPSSIGFILDNLGDTIGTHGSSLFSDIASNIEVSKSNNTQIIPNIDDIMTEESHSDVKPDSKHSSVGSTDPYVSCVNGITRDGETSECFESCVERFSSDLEKIQQSTEHVNSHVDSILSKIDTSKTTPINRNLVTSTPEKTSNSSEESSPISSKEEERQKWVPALILSSEEEEEPCLSDAEEYEYTDLQEKVVLIEKRYLTADSAASHTKRTPAGNGPSSTTEEYVGNKNLTSPLIRTNSKENNKYNIVPYLKELEDMIASSRKKSYAKDYIKSKINIISEHHIGKPYLSSLITTNKDMERSCIPVHHIKRENSVLSLLTTNTNKRKDDFISEESDRHVNYKNSVLSLLTIKSKYRQNDQIINIPERNLKNMNLNLSSIPTQIKKSDNSEITNISEYYKNLNSALSSVKTNTKQRQKYGITDIPEHHVDSKYPVLSSSKTSKTKESDICEITEISKHHLGNTNPVLYSVTTNTKKSEKDEMTDIPEHHVNNIKSTQSSITTNNKKNQKYEFTGIPEHLLGNETSVATSIIINCKESKEDESSDIPDHHVENINSVKSSIATNNNEIEKNETTDILQQHVENMNPVLISIRTNNKESEKDESTTIPKYHEENMNTVLSSIIKNNKECKKQKTTDIPENHAEILKSVQSSIVTNNKERKKDEITDIPEHYVANMISVLSPITTNLKESKRNIPEQCLEKINSNMSSLTTNTKESEKEEMVDEQNVKDMRPVLSYISTHPMASDKDEITVISEHHVESVNPDLSSTITININENIKELPTIIPELVEDYSLDLEQHKEDLGEDKLPYLPFPNFLHFHDNN